MSEAIREQEICFIICSNNALYTEECIYYIMHLNVPEGYQVNVLTVENAESMAAGYNEGMKASHAKYKVYLHQDTFIVNRDFIQDFLDVFRQDEEIGMIGMVGAPSLPASGIMWEAPRTGALYTWHVCETKESWMSEDDMTQVEVIDGFLMITQYDIPWREDLFDKWDFYDCSQSKEFARHGYKVVVPRLGKPWCIHDSGYVGLDHYDEERIKFLREYCQEIPALKNQNSCRVTVVVTSHNQKESLQDTLAWLADVDGVSNIIVADNGSEDGTASWLSSKQYDYLWFDEGVQGYGKLWNTVLQNFETEDYIVFLEAGVFPERRSLLELAQALCEETVGAANPISKYYQGDGRAINSIEELSLFRLANVIRIERDAFCKTLSFNWRIWAVRKDVFDRNGFFNEEIKEPESVLTDFTLRMIKNGLSQTVCFRACAYENLCRCEEIYTEAEQWRLEDRTVMKAVWGMKYFNLKPNGLLVKHIQEPAEKEFKVLEVGCDLGATLLEIERCYPNCHTYGLDINKEAIEIARHITKAEYGNIDELKIPFEEKFDYIIFGDVLEHLRHPEEVIRMCHDRLTENGYIVASIPNLMHISVMEELIEGRFRYSDIGLLDRTHIHFFTYYEIMNLFQEAGYAVRDINRTVFDMSERQKGIVDALLRLSDHTESWMYETFQYTVKAQKIVK